MRYVWFCVLLFLGVACGCASADLPPYSAVRADLDKGIYNAMSRKGIIVDSRVRWLAMRVREKNPKLGKVLVVSDPELNAAIGPSDIYLNSGLVAKASNGGLTGVIVCCQYLIESGYLEKNYDQVARTINNFRLGGGSEENARVLEKYAFQVVNVFNRDAVLLGDEVAWKTLPELGFPSSDYTDLLSTIGSGGKLFSDIPARLQAINKLGEAPKVEKPAPKDELDDANQKMREALRLARVKEVDPVPFMPAFDGKPVEGWSYAEIRPGQFLFFNRGGKVAKPRKGGGVLGALLDSYRIGNSDSSGGSAEKWYLDDGKKNRATEAVLLVKNQNPTSGASFFLVARVNTDLGFAGVPDKYRFVPKNNFYEKSQGDWPMQTTLAVRFNVDDLKGENQFAYLVCYFKAKGNEEGQFTSYPQQLKVQFVPIILLR